MKKLNYEQVAIKFRDHLAEISLSTEKDAEKDVKMVSAIIAAVVDSINECIEEESYAGKNVKFRQDVRLIIIGERVCTFAQGAKAKCLSDNGETIEVESPRGDSYTSEKRLVYLSEDQ